MAKPKEPINPFYAVLVVACGTFLVTILMYLTSLLEQARSSPLARFMDKSGQWVVYGEVAVMVVAGIGAMVLDRVRSRRQAASRHRQEGQADAPLEGRGV